MSNNKDYQLTAKQAAKKLGKSVTTVHRYVRKGKLSGKYVDTEHGKEVRLKEDEVQSLGEKVNLEDGKLPSTEKEPTTGSSNCLDTTKLLGRYERILYQLGQLTEKLEAEKNKRKDKIDRLEKERGRLSSQLHDKSALIEALENELTRPLTFKERLKGERITNH